MTRIVLLSSIVLAAAACGGSSKPAATEPASGGGAMGAGGGEGEHEHHFPARVTAFHDRLAPLWHADPGDARTDGTCAATGELDQLGEDLQNAAAPDGVDATAWSEKIDGLRTAVSHLGDNCVAGQLATFDADFTAVHDAFHHLIELLPDQGH
jgi:hypothetical protein